MMIYRQVGTERALMIFLSRHAKFNAAALTRQRGNLFIAGRCRVFRRKLVSTHFHSFCVARAPPIILPTFRWPTMMREYRQPAVVLTVEFLGGNRFLQHQCRARIMLLAFNTHAAVSSAFVCNKEINADSLLLRRTRSISLLMHFIRERAAEERSLLPPRHDLFH